MIALAALAKAPPTYQRVAVIAIAVLVVVVVVELVRRRRLMERYALLWLGAARLLFVLAVWQGLLTTLSTEVGIRSPPNALFAVGFAFVVVLLLSSDARDLSPDRAEQAARATRRPAGGPSASARAGALRDVNDALAVVVVTHNSVGELAALATSLAAQLDPDDEFVIVDNASARRDRGAGALRWGSGSQ